MWPWECRSGVPGRPLAAPPAGTRYAGFWIRLAAYVLDSVAVDGITFALLNATKPIRCVTSDGSTCLPGTSTVSPLLYVFSAIPVVYFVVMWALGGTVGQRVLGLRVVNASTGANLGVGRAMARYLGYLVAAAALFMGLVWAGFDRRKQGWHDKIANSVVLRPE
jgi:uncharacterized RDD family membrane protein YckC